MNKIETDDKKILKEEERLSKYEGEDRMVSSHELAEELAQTKEEEFKYQTGIPSMDRILDGVEAGEMIVVTGPTGEGKTTLLMTITQNMIKSGAKSAWFTLEVTPRQFIKKISNRGELPLFYMPKKNVDKHIKWIEERIIESIAKYNTRVIFIDHLHEIFNLIQYNSSNTSLQLGHLISGIKDLATTHNLVIFLIAHSKDNPISPMSEPRKEDIRDSGLISRGADTIMGVWRVNNDAEKALKPKRPKELDEEDTWSKVRVMKNRREGKLGYWIMDHKDHYLEEIDPNEIVF